MNVTRVVLSEEERQMALLAFAVLSLHRPGWDWALNNLALKMDNEREGRGQLYEQFRKLNADQYGPVNPRRCPLCAEGNPRVRSSVSDAWVHTDTPTGRRICLEQEPVEPRQTD